MADPEVIASIVTANRRFADTFPGEAAVRPDRGLAVVTCMDARIDLGAILGLEVGDAHIIRNAGAIVTEDVIRSLCLSQRVLGTSIIVVVGHTDCGLEGVSDHEFSAGLASETGQTPQWRAGGFRQVDEAVGASLRRLEQCPFLPHREAIAGFVYGVATGVLRPVKPAG